jgi:hypothetical protein
MARKQGVVNRDVNATQRARLAVEQRAQRLTYQQIANNVGYGTPGACRDAIMRELDRCIVKDVEALRTQELDMLDRLHAAVWPLAVPDGDEEEEEDEGKEKKRVRKKRVNLFAVDRVIAISERRSRLLGLDVTPNSNIAAAQIIIREYAADVEAV